MTDIVPALNETITLSFQDRMMRDRRLVGISNRIRDGTATMVDSHVYAERVGINLSGAMRDAIREDVLPDGRMYYNIAKRTVTPALQTTYDLVNDTAADVLRIADEADGINLGSVKADFPEERINGLIDKIVTPEYDFEQMIVWFGEPIINNVEAFNDDFIRENADFRGRAGLETFITRTASHGCCQWCAGLTGTFPYDGAPAEIYARHDFCRCTVTFTSKRDSKWQSQDVWSKRSWESTPAELQRRQMEGAESRTMTAQERINQATRLERDRAIEQYMAENKVSRARAVSAVTKRR